MDDMKKTENTANQQHFHYKCLGLLLERGFFWCDLSFPAINVSEDSHKGSKVANLNVYFGH